MARPLTLTANGNAQVSTTSPKIGTGAALFDGTGDYIDTPDDTSFNIGSGNFTIEFFFKRADSGNVEFLCGQATAGGDEQWGIRFNATDVLRWNNAVTFYTDYRTLTAATAITSTTTWYHCAVVRNGNTVTLYLDGTSDGTVDVTGATFADPTTNFSIGRTGVFAGLYLNGRVDEFRWSNIARYTGNFTPTTTAFTSDANTILLMHADGADGSQTFTDDNISASMSTLDNVARASISTIDNLAIASVSTWDNLA